jgi:hypothetical protein
MEPLAALEESPGPALLESSSQRDRLAKQRNRYTGVCVAVYIPAADLTHERSARSNQQGSYVQSLGTSESQSMVTASQRDRLAKQRNRYTGVCVAVYIRCRTFSLSFHSDLTHERSARSNQQGSYVQSLGTSESQSMVTVLVSRRAGRTRRHWPLSKKAPARPSSSPRLSGTVWPSSATATPENRGRMYKVSALARARAWLLYWRIATPSTIKD